MKTLKVLGMMAVALGFAQVVHADEFDRGIERCQESSSEPSVVRSCLKSGRARISSALSELGGGGFTADVSLSGLTSRTGVTWGTIALDGEEIDLMNQYDAFEHCLNLNPESDRARVAAALGYSRSSSTGRWEQNTASRRMSRTQLRAALREGDVYLPARVDFDGVRAGELGNHLCWSSSVHPDYSDYAYDFYWRDGDIVSYYRDGPGSAVRCVRR